MLISGSASSGSTAALIFTAPAQGAHLWIYNSGSSAVYLGPSTVTTSTGAYVSGSASGSTILENARIEIALGNSDALYSICTSGSVALAYLAQA